MSLFQEVEKVYCPGPKYSNIHVIGHLEGLCHIYLDKENNLNDAIKVIFN